MKFFEMKKAMAIEAFVLGKKLDKSFQLSYLLS